MKKRLILLITLLISYSFVYSSDSKFTTFVERKNDKLYDNGKELRFISFNIPNLHYIEDYLPFDSTNPWRLPDEFEIRDALTAIKHLNGKVVRIYVLSVRRDIDTPDIIRHVEGPGKFNEEAFKALDKVLQIANEIGIRIIIPLVDNWHWWGGPKEYASFRGKDRDAFWSDPEIISDFKKTIEFVINRKNTFTGVLYKDDKAIFGWETGNELNAPYEWTKEIAAYIKSLDKNHLVIEGRNSPDLSIEAIQDTNIDVVTTHHYRDTKSNLEKIVANQKLARGKKPYFVGEFGIVPTQEIRAIMDTIINQGLVGGLLWSLRFRNREGGFYNHYEYNKVSAYRWPGFSSGEWYNEKLILNMVREKAYQIDGKTVPMLPVPEPPVLFEFDDVSQISWQGSAGAESYIIERREEDSDEWEVIADNVDDAKYQYRPLFNDETAEFDKRYFYRIAAKNESGISDYSNIVGPVKVKFKKIVDEMENFDKVFQKDGEFKLLTYQDIRRAKEDRSRLTGKDGSYLIYKSPMNISEIKVEFFLSDDGDIKIEAGNNLDNLEEVSIDKQIFKFGKNDYNFFDAVRYTATNIPENSKFVKIIINEGVQISRVEIKYQP
ncbi:cellulase family glycosylhydrolase [Rosettibacter firmus]|uniref:cellulase family glycosylhydrolase n=1 Tax=Rosettibacter firmus TaxID=3111522 RepID=UPI00336C04E4